MANTGPRNSNKVNPRYNVEAAKEKLPEVKPIRNQIFQHKSLHIPGDYPDEYYDYEDDDENDAEEEGNDNGDGEDKGNDDGEDEEGKWMGRNKNEDDKNVAVEEEDEPAAAVANDKIVIEDVGGDVMKKNKDNTNNDKNKKKKKKRKKKHKANHVKGEPGDRTKKLSKLNKFFGKGEDLYPQPFEFGVKVEGEDEKGGRVVYDVADLEDQKGIESIMNMRRTRVKDVCARYGLGPDAPKDMPKAFKYPPTPNYDVFYIDRSVS